MDIHKIIDLDKKLLVYLNNLGSSTFDSFWLFITKQSNWMPLFLLLLYLVYTKLGIKKTIILLVFIALLILINNEFTEFIKAYFHRLRPCNDIEIKDVIRNLKPSNTFGFFSGHSSNTMAVFIFLYLIFKQHYKYFFVLILWPLIFSYSRIYLGLHFPLDIICGFVFGACMGFLWFYLYRFLILKFETKKIA